MELQYVITSGAPLVAYQRKTTASLKTACRLVEAAKKNNEWIRVEKDRVTTYTWFKSPSED